MPDSGHHRHSRIATLTYVAVGSVRYEDKNGSTGVLRAGGMDARLRRSLA
ncbi:MAG TPA: pirin family protein [Bryobacteraceae bacterium]|nr:pirin family protein [Bryobacteraceae bacterium]